MWAMRGLRRGQHWLKCRLDPPAVILMYHRVTELANDPHLLAVRPAHFDAHLDAIRDSGTPITLQELAGALGRFKLPKRAVVLTFDDGYADNLYHAQPILARHDIPATVFVTAGQLDRGREFWWDELDRVFLQPGILPAVLQLRVDGQSHEWRLEGTSNYTQEAYQHDRHWNLESQEDPGPRQRLFRAVFDLVHRLPTRQRWEILDQLVAWAGAPQGARETHRTLTSDELARLANGGHIEIGAHTMTHPALVVLPPEEQRGEIEGSKTRLEEIIGADVTSFAYPHGSLTPETSAIVRDTGFACACSSEVNGVFRRADRFRLPRICVRDWNAETLARLLAYWFGD